VEILHRTMSLANTLFLRTGQTLGEGTYGNVMLVSHKGKDYAVKRQFTHDEAFFYAAVREEFCGGFDHPNLIHRFSSKWQNYCWCGVFEVGEPLTYKSPSQRVLWDVLKGLAFLHARGIVHRDITPSNIVKVGDTFKIIDFGLSRTLPYTTQCQTPDMVTMPWRPIELLTGGMTDVRCDIWSLGVVCLTLYRRRPVFIGAAEDMIAQYNNLTFDYHEQIYARMVCDLQCRWTSFKLCSVLGLDHDLTVPHHKVPDLVQNIVKGVEVDFTKYNKSGVMAMYLHQNNVH